MLEENDLCSARPDGKPDPYGEIVNPAAEAPYKTSIQEYQVGRCCLSSKTMITYKGRLREGSDKPGFVIKE